MREKEQFANYFRGIHTRFSRLYTHFLTEMDLTLPQYTLLNQLENSGVIPMTEASDRLHVSKPAVTHLVDRLEKKRFLKRVPHEKDRRICLLQIQPQGSRIVQKAQNLALGFFMGTLREFHPDERKIMERFYSLLSQRMDRVLAGRQKGER